MFCFLVFLAFVYQRRGIELERKVAKEFRSLQVLPLVGFFFKKCRTSVANIYLNPVAGRVFLALAICRK